MRHAIVEQGTNKVVNVVIWEGKEWLPPRGHYVVRHDDCDIDDTWDPKTNSFIKPPERSNK